MPEIARFYGIIIRMYFGDHLPPHFHALYGDEEVIVDIETLAIVHGHLAPRALGLVAEWASLHQSELRNAWHRAKNYEHPGKIEPLP